MSARFHSGASTSVTSGYHHEEAVPRVSIPRPNVIRSIKFFFLFLCFFLIYLFIFFRIFFSFFLRFILHVAFRCSDNSYLWKWTVHSRMAWRGIGWGGVDWGGVRGTRDKESIRYILIWIERNENEVEEKEKRDIREKKIRDFVRYIFHPILKSIVIKGIEAIAEV